jgi:hypothetical protein
MSFQYVCWSSQLVLWLRIVIHLQVLTFGRRIAIAMRDLECRSRVLAMLGELTNIPTDTLVDMLYLIVAGEAAITASDVVEIEQIQRELQRRGGQNWSCGAVN